MLLHKPGFSGYFNMSVKITLSMCACLCRQHITLPAHKRAKHSNAHGLVLKLQAFWAFLGFTGCWFCSQKVMFGNIHIRKLTWRIFFVIYRK